MLLALALINQPDLLFLDEPSTGLDPQARRNLWEIISTVKAQGKTIILTTHYMEEAQHMCDEVAIMDQGKLVAQGPPGRLVADFSKGALIHLDVKALDKSSGTIPFKMTRQNHRLSIHVTNMNHDLGILLELGVDLSSMDVEMPNLETVFLNINRTKFKGINMSLKRIWSMFIARSREFYRDKAAFGWNVIFPFLLVGGFALIFGGENTIEYKIGIFPCSSPSSSKIANCVPVRSGPDTSYRLRIDTRFELMASISLKHHKIDMLLQIDTRPYPYWINDYLPKRISDSVCHPRISAGRR